MALIKCPECGNNISDKAEACIHCGFPLSYNINTNSSCEISVSDEQLEDIYSDCDKKRMQMVQKVAEITGWDLIKSKNRVDEFWNEKFPQKKLNYTPQGEISKKDNRNPQHVFKGIYKYNFWGKREEVYCPRCSSENCSHYKEQNIINEKTRYTLNLNPLRPLTVLNKKEEQKHVTVDKIICNDCGKVFQ